MNIQLLTWWKNYWRWPSTTLPFYAAMQILISKLELYSVQLSFWVSQWSFYDIENSGISVFSPIVIFIVVFFCHICLNFNTSTSYKTCGLNSCVQHILSYPVYNHWMYLAQILFCVWNLTLSVILFISMCHSGGRIDGHYCLGTSHNIKRIPTTTGICMQTVVISICIWQPRPLAFVIWRTYNTLPLATWPDR